jgi:hypothetical protein
MANAGPELLLHDAVSASGSINQISGWPEDENPVVFSDVFAGSLDYQMGFCRNRRERRCILYAQNTD